MCLVLPLAMLVLSSTLLDLATVVSMYRDVRVVAIFVGNEHENLRRYSNAASSAMLMSAPLPVGWITTRAFTVNTQAVSRRGGSSGRIAGNRARQMRPDSSSADQSGIRPSNKMRRITALAISTARSATSAAGSSPFPWTLQRLGDAPPCISALRSP